MSSVNHLRGILTSAQIAAATVVCGLVIYAVLIRVLRRLQAKIPVHLPGVVVSLTRLFAPLLALIPAGALAAALPFLGFPPDVHSVVAHVLALWIIAAVAWLSIRLVAVASDMIMNRQQVQARDNLRARRIDTQIRIIERVVSFIIVLFAIAFMLMTFSQVQEIGASILASAGVVGIIVGFAAQRSLGTVFAGLQIAFTQPIRIDDVVVIEGEWGWIEEITLTYVVMKIWDERRLIIPITNFLEKPFQNWTRTTAQLQGTVFIYADYTLPVQKVREILHQTVINTPLWDRRVWGLQVTNTTDRSVELRALVSAVDSSSLWNLRCLVREKLLEFLQQHYPSHLPRVRIEMERDVSDAKDFSRVGERAAAAGDRPP